MENIPEEPKKSKKAPVIIGASILVIAIGIIAVIFLKPEPTCYEQSQEFIAALDPLISEWSDAYQVAKSTSRIALGPAVANLQDIRRQIDGLDVPECAELAQGRFIQSADATINGFLAFMEDESDTIVSQYLDAAVTYMYDFQQQYIIIKNSADQ